MKATGNILKWKVNGPKIQGVFLALRIESLPTESNLKVADRQGTIHGTMKLGELVV